PYIALSVFIRVRPRDPRPKNALFLSRQQRQHFKMRRAALARDALAAQHLQARLACELAQFLVAESEVAVIERHDGVAVSMACQGCGEETAARFERARRF